MQWPEEPKRKGKRCVERMPYVISSEKYQKILEDKEKKKAEELALKEERKRKREEVRTRGKKVIYEPYMIHIWYIYVAYMRC